jgi:O-antigen ligase
MSGFLFVKICYNKNRMVKIIKILLWALAFTPLIVDNSVLSPYTAGKSFFVFGIIVLISILFLVNFFYNKKFKEEIVNKINTYLRYPLTISIIVFISSILVSTIFAVDKYRAFWGDIDRAEGLIGMLCFFSVFIFTLLIYEKKNWLLFFKLSLITTLLVVLKEFYQFFIGIERPGSFLGNPTFLAGYLLFSIFCAVIIYGETIPLETARARSGHLSLMGWRYFSIITLILSILGIFIAETRGTILGLIVGIIFVLIYGIFKGKNISYKKLNLRKSSIIILCFIVAFSIFFISTRRSEIWQNIPGLGRVAVINIEDTTTQTRLFTAKASIKAVNPLQNGWKKLLLGWGPENFSLANQEYFDYKQFNYEMISYDRAHNKLLDLLVMDGILGLVTYLSIFFFFFYYIFRKKDFSLINLGLLFWGVAYLVHLLLFFDQVTTQIPFFITLSFVIYLANENVGDKKNVNNQNNLIKGRFIIGIFFIILCLFMNYIFFVNSLLGYMQMHKFQSLLKKDNAEGILSKINPIFSPFTVAQADIRKNLLVFLQKNYNADNPNINKLVDIAVSRGEEYLKNEPLDLKSTAFFATVCTNIGKNSNNLDLLKKGENYFRILLSFSSNRPDYNYGLATNLFHQKKYDESFPYFEKALNLGPAFFLKEKENVEHIYIYFLQYFYQKKNKENFIDTVERLKQNGDPNSGIFDQAAKYLEKNNKWPNINFNAG